MAGGAFIGMLRVGIFLLIIWGASRLSRMAPQWMCVSSIILEITSGLIMSPQIAGLIPKEYSECLYEITDDCDTRYTLNHIQEKHADCDYDAYMARDGFVLATQGGHGSGAGASGASSATGGSSAGDSSSHSSTAQAGTSSAASSHSSAADHSSAASSDSSAADHSSAASSASSAAPSASSAADHSSAAGHASATVGHDTSTDTSHASSGSHSTSGSASSGSSATHSSATSHSSASSGSAAASSSDTQTSAHRRLSADHKSEDNDFFALPGSLLSLPSGVSERRLSGTSYKGKTKYDNYEQCLEMMCKLEIAHECTLTPNIFSFIGHVGVALMIFESGMHFDFDKAQQFGVQSCAIACLGTFLPLVFGTLAVIVLCGEPFFPQGVSAGTALAPTSVGIALKLLTEAGQLQKDHGQIIITAAFVDDILSLVLFNCLFSIGAGEMSFMTFLPAIIGVALMAFIVWFAWARHADNILNKLLDKVKGKEKKWSNKDQVLFFIMMMMVIIFGTGFFYTGTHLWGCFMAGMCLARSHIAHHVWVKQTKHMTKWMIRIFFSCTVAFAIPIGDLISLESFWKGSIMGIGPCVLTKVFAAFWRTDRFVIGWAMVGRAEFAYLIAQLAASSNMLSPKVFSVVIWALLYATVLAPFMFRKVLQGYTKKLAEDAAGGKFTAEESKQWDADHEGEFEFRQSGHLPVLEKGLLSEPTKGHEDRQDSKKSSGSHGGHADELVKEKSTGQVVHSEAQEDAPHADSEKAVLSANAHHNSHAPENPQHCPSCEHYAPTGDKEDLNHAQQQGARGSGFLCCLFFRKIIIM